MSPPPPSSTDGAPPSVFICYRREETAAHAGRLYDAMVVRFGEHNVFMDVDIAPGANFVEEITEVVSGCVVLILVMGPKWATVEDENGKARLTNPDDFVRLELETALRRPEVTPIPCLVAGARMPKRDQLPPELHPITYRNALELNDMRWGSDVERLHTTLDVLLADTLETKPATPVVEPPTPEPSPVPEPSPTPPPETAAPPPPAPASSDAAPGRRLVLEGMLVAATTAFAGRMIAEAIPEGSDDLTNIANVVARRGATWALVALALVVWLAGRDSGRLAGRGVLTGALAGALGGAIWALPVFLSTPTLDFNGTEANWIQIGSLAVTGALLGRLLAELWEPHRLGTGLACGAAAGALIQIATIALGLSFSGSLEVSLYFGLAAAAIAGLPLAVLSQPRR